MIYVLLSKIGDVYVVKESMYEDIHYGEEFTEEEVTTLVSYGVEIRYENQ